MAERGRERRSTAIPKENRSNKYATVVVRRDRNEKQYLRILSETSKVDDDIEF